MKLDVNFCRVFLKNFFLAYDFFQKPMEKIKINCFAFKLREIDFCPVLEPIIIFD